MMLRCFGDLLPRHSYLSVKAVDRIDAFAVKWQTAVITFGQLSIFVVSMNGFERKTVYILPVEVIGSIYSAPIWGSDAEWQR